MLRGFISGSFWGVVIAFLVVGLTSQLADWRDLTPAVSNEIASAAPAATTPDLADTGPGAPAADVSARPVSEAPGVAPATAEVASPAVDTATADVPQSGAAPGAPAPAPAEGEAAPAAPAQSAAAPDAPRQGVAAPDPAAPDTEIAEGAVPAPQPPRVVVGAPVPGTAPAPSGAVDGVAQTENDVIALARPKTVPQPAAPDAEIAETPAPAAPPAPAPQPSAQPAAPAEPAPQTEPVETPAPETGPAPAPQPAPAPAPQPEAEPEEGVAPEPQPAPQPQPAAQPQPSGDLPESGTIGDMAEGVTVNRLPVVTAPPAPEPEPQMEADPALADEISDDAIPVDPSGAPLGLAILRNSVPFERESSAPLVSMVLIHEGDAMPDTAVLAGIPVPVSFAVDARLANAGAIANAYRSAGREVALIPDIPARAKPSDVEVALSINLRDVPSAVAIMDAPEPRFQTDRNAVAQVVDTAAAEGYGLVTFSRGLNSASKEAGRAGVPAGLIFRDVDDGDPDIRALRRTLDQAAFRARQEDRVILLARTRPETLDAFVGWATDAGPAGTGELAFAPLSAVLLGK